MPKNLEATIDINAAPEAVWTVVSDLKRMPEWSPQCRVMQPLGKLKEGTRTININKQGWKYWPTTSKVVRFEPNKAVAFKVVENGSTWSFELAPSASGTKLTERRDVSNGTTKVSQIGIGKVLGGEPSFEVELVDGMQSTLAKIKRAVEQG
ncbi:SRPBCC family protein [Antrihabitans stalactiti]|uniref:SRPBCC family protein n=1 Tax=Antrihabitans stalactiti TaxID=2584121 RepID=A0A848KJQ9_9NOCA|nr:SRPBCC family protein [Antrihabitans stalactiti]